MMEFEVKRSGAGAGEKKIHARVPSSSGIAVSRRTDRAKKKGASGALYFVHRGGNAGGRTRYQAE
jgi:hypothetical protein